MVHMPERETELARLYESQVVRWSRQVQTYREAMHAYQQALQVAAGRRIAAALPLSLSGTLTTDRTPDRRASRPAGALLVRPDASPSEPAPNRTELLPAPPRDTPVGSAAPGALQLLGQRAVGAPACPLTARQLEVTALIARGRTNYQIARELILTPGTVANHVRNILQKLGFESRVQIAVWATDRGLGNRQ